MRLGVDTRLLVSLALTLTMVFIVPLVPWIFMLVPYFSLVLFFAVWKPTKLAILILSALNTLLMYFGLIKNYVFFETIVHTITSATKTSPKYAWITLIYWAPVICLCETLAACVTVKKLKLMERIGV